MRVYNGYNADTFGPPNSERTTGWSSIGGIFASKAYFSEYFVRIFPEKKIWWWWWWWGGNKGYFKKSKQHPQRNGIRKLCKKGWGAMQGSV